MTFRAGPPNRQGMSAPTLIKGLSQVAADYDVLFCDVWGVVHNGRQAFRAACEALAAFRRDQGPVVLISNSPRPSRDVAAQLDALGVPREAWSGFVTSGDATRAELIRRAPGPAWALGPARDGPLYEGTGVALAEVPEEAAFISCTGPFDDELDVPEDYRGRFETCLARDLEMVCANPDRVVHRGARLIYCAGALADLYEQMGGRVVMAGKPFGPIYDLTFAEAERQLGRPVDRSRVLAIGDGLPTDVEGANRQGLDLLFIAAGIHGEEARGDDGGLDAEKVQALLDGAGAKARYAMLELV